MANKMLEYFVDLYSSCWLLPPRRAGQRISLSLDLLWRELSLQNVSRSISFKIHRYDISYFSRHIVPSCIRCLRGEKNSYCHSSVKRIGKSFHETAYRVLTFFQLSIAVSSYVTVKYISASSSEIPAPDYRIWPTHLRIALLLHEGQVGCLYTYRLRMEWVSLVLLVSCETREYHVIVQLQ